MRFPLSTPAPSTFCVAGCYGDVPVFRQILLPASKEFFPLPFSLTEFKLPKNRLVNVMDVLLNQQIEQQTRKQLLSKVNSFLQENSSINELVNNATSFYAVTFFLYDQDLTAVIL